jgi:hypothetical protein
MNTILDGVVRATGNVELANKELLEASTTSADFRFFVLLFLCIMTITLLFLHNYNP